MFQKMPIILLCVIFLSVLFNALIPENAQSFFLAMGMSIKTLIMFFLPAVIFSLLFKTAVHLSKSATKIILILLAAICCSNLASTMVSYHVGLLVHQFDLSIVLPPGSSGLQPAWSFSLPKWISNSYALFAGLASGVLLAMARPALAEWVAGRLDRIVGVILRLMTLAMPFFIAGFAMKMAFDGVIVGILRDYVQIFLVIIVSVFAYIALLYFIANRFQWSLLLSSFKNILPASVVGFGSMSSAAAMPLTIMGVEKSTKYPEIARSVVPATVNVHLIGDCFAIPIFAFAVLKNFGVAPPDFAAYLIFAFYFVMAKFSVAAIPGGGIIVMLPILESALGFNAEMLSLVTALYLLFDPVITSANVLGNGGFAMLFSRLYGLMRQKKC